MGSPRRIIGQIKSKLIPTRQEPLSLSEIAQLRSWQKGKAQKPKFNLRELTPEERLTRVVAKRGKRHGTKIKLKQLKLISGNKNEQKILRETYEEIKKAQSKSFTKSKTKFLHAKIRLLKRCILFRQITGKKPTVFHVLAVTALKHGLNSIELKKEISTLRTIWSQTRDHVLWEGTPTNLDLTFRTNPSLFYDIESVLFKDKHLSNKQIAEKLSLTWNLETQNKINVSMQLLETCRLIRKLPFTAESGRAIGVWVHTAHKNPKINYANPGIYLLNKLHSSAKDFLNASELYKQTSGFGDVWGNPNARFDRRSIFDVLEILKANKIVTTKKTHSSDGGIKIKITEYGKTLMDAYKRNKMLPEKLRKILVDA